MKEGRKRKNTPMLRIRTYCPSTLLYHNSRTQSADCDYALSTSLIPLYPQPRYGSRYRSVGSIITTLAHQIRGSILRPTDTLLPLWPRSGPERV